MMMHTDSDSAFWHYYSWCQEMEALREEQEQEQELEEQDEPKGWTYWDTSTGDEQL